MNDRLQSEIAQVERRLTRHYLWHDLEGRSGPLNHFDTRHETLAIVLGTHDPISLLVHACGPWQLLSRLYGNAITEGLPVIEGCPGYFRQLVLPCALVSDEECIDSARDLRKSLRAVYSCGEAKPFQELGGIASLWHRLQRWCAREHIDGSEIRQLTLPDPGRFVQIGHVYGLALPSWRDAYKLRRLFGRGHTERDASQANLTYRIAQRVRDETGFTGAIRLSAIEYISASDRGATLLDEHPFLQIVAAASDSRSQVAGAAFGFTYTNDPFSGCHELSIVTRDEQGDEEIVESGPVSALLEKLRTSLVNEVSLLGNAISNGLVPIEESRFGVWCESLPVPAARIKLLFRSDRSKLLDQIGLGRNFEVIDESWSMLAEAVDSDSLFPLRNFWNVSAGTWIRQVARQHRVTNGYKVARGIYLGRNGYLPILRFPPTLHAELYSIDSGASDPLRFIIGDGHIPTSAHLQGRHRLVVHDTDDSCIERSLTFARDAHLSAHPFDPHTGLYDSEDPLTFRVHAGKSQLGSRGTSTAARCDGLQSLLEALYTRVERRSGWSEREIAEMARAAMEGGDVNPWDLLHVLEVERWIRPWRLQRWNARRWFLVPTHLIRSPYDPMRVTLSGSTPQAWISRFKQRCEQHGIAYEARSNLGIVSPERWDAYGDAPERIAHVLELPLHDPQWIGIDPAPVCWPIVEERVLTSVHLLTKTWDWTLERFTALGTPNAIELTRHDDPNRRQPTLYRVTGGAKRIPDFLARVRQHAVTEAYRRAARPLICLHGEGLACRASGLVLPVTAAQALVDWSGRGCGMARGKSGWRVLYPGETAAAECLRRWFGETIVHGGVSASRRGLIDTVLGNRGLERAARDPAYRRWLNDRFPAFHEHPWRTGSVDKGGDS